MKQIKNLSRKILNYAKSNGTKKPSAWLGLCHIKNKLILTKTN